MARISALQSIACVVIAVLAYWVLVLKPPVIQSDDDIDVLSVCSPTGTTPIQNRLFETLGIAPVRAVHWRGHYRFVLKLNEPVIVENSPAANWTAHGRWDPDFISTYPASFKSVHVSNNSHFVYSRPEDTPFPWANTRDKFPSYATTTMAASDFFEICHTAAGSERRFAYYSGQAIFEDSPDFLTDVTPYRQFVIESALVGMNDFAQANVWLGCAGVTAQLHYDSSYNFYTQIFGQKMFILFPPGYADCVDLEPVAHPSYRQSQMMDLATLTSSQLNSLQECGARRGLGAPKHVTLQPGQTLFLPAFWLHYVRACTTSISVNVWTNSHSLGVADELMRHPVPVELSWTIDQFFGGFVAYVGCVDTAAFATKRNCTQLRDISRMVNSGSHPISRIYLQRWRPLFAGLFEPGSDQIVNTSFCAAVFQSAASQSFVTLPNITCSFMSQAQFGSPAQMEHLVVSSKRAGRIAQLERNPEILRLLLDNYYDQLFGQLLQVRLRPRNEVPLEDWTFCVLHRLYTELQATMA